MFYCKVCNCDLKNPRPLRDHVRGNNHIRKALEFKRSVLGLPMGLGSSWWVVGA